MKRSLGTIVFVLIALTNLFAQTEEQLAGLTELPLRYDQAWERALDNDFVKGILSSRVLASFANIKGFTYM